MGPGSPSAEAPPENEGPQERGPVDRSCVRPILFHRHRRWPDNPSAMTLKDLHELGGTREQIEEALRIMPFVSST